MKNPVVTIRTIDPADPKQFEVVKHIDSDPNVISQMDDSGSSDKELKDFVSPRFIPPAGVWGIFNAQKLVGWIYYYDLDKHMRQSLRKAGHSLPKAARILEVAYAKDLRETTPHLMSGGLKTSLRNLPNLIDERKKYQSAIRKVANKLSGDKTSTFAIYAFTNPDKNPQSARVLTACGFQKIETMVPYKSDGTDPVYPYVYQG